MLLDMRSDAILELQKSFSCRSFEHPGRDHRRAQDGAAGCLERSARQLSIARRLLGSHSAATQHCRAVYCWVAANTATASGCSQHMCTLLRRLSWHVFMHFQRTEVHTTICMYTCTVAVDGHVDTSINCVYPGYQSSVSERSQRALHLFLLTVSRPARADRAPRPGPWPPSER